MTLLISGYETELTRKATTADTTLYVDTLPTGMTTPYYLMVDAGESTAEIVKVTATGTSPNTLTVTRAISLTSHTESATGTAYDHQVGSKIALTDIHLYFDDKQIRKSAATFTGDLETDTTGNRDGDLAVVRDTRVVYMWNDGAGAWQSTVTPATPGDASSTTKGITKLSVNPAVSTNPIALGQNDTTVLFNNADQTMDTDKKLQFRDTGIYLQSSSDGVFELVSDTTINLTAPTINFAGSTQVDFGTSPVDLGTGALTIDGATTVSNTFNITGTSAAFSISQTNTAGNAMSITRDLDSASTDSPLISFVNDHSGDDQNLLDIRQDGTGTGVDIEAAGVLAASKYALRVYSNTAQVTTDALAKIHLDEGTSTVTGLYVEQDGTGHGIQSTSVGVLAASKHTLSIYSNAAQVNSELFDIHQDNASSTADASAITNDGTGQALMITQAGVLASSKRALSIYSNAAQTNAELVKIHSDNASSDQPLLVGTQDGTGKLLFLNATNTGSTNPVIDIDTEQANDSPVINIDLPSATNAFQVRQNTDVTNDVTLKLGANYYWTDTNDDLRYSSSPPTSDSDGDTVGMQAEVVAGSRTTGEGSGNEDVSFSFTPRAIMITATYVGLDSQCTGMSDGTTHNASVVYNNGNSTEENNANCIYLRDSAGTLRWNATASFAVANTVRLVFTANSPSADCNYSIIAFR